MIRLVLTAQVGNNLFIATFKVKEILKLINKCLAFSIRGFYHQFQDEIRLNFQRKAVKRSVIFLIKKTVNKYIYNYNLL